MSEDTAVASEVGRDQAIKEIVTLLGINGGAVPESIEEFWYQVALAAKVGIPADGMTKMAMQIFAKLDEEWDDDYLAEDGEGLSLEAYETLYDALKRATPGETKTAEQLEVDTEGAEDDDDSIGPV